MKKKRIEEYLSPIAICGLALGVASLVILLLAMRYTAVADFVNRTVGALMRAFLALVTYPFPFSVFELLLILIIPLTVFFVVSAIRRGRDTVSRIRVALSVIGLLGFIFTSYVFTLGVGYRTTPLSQELGLRENTEINADDLTRVTKIVKNELISLYDKIEIEDGESLMPYSISEMNSKLNLSFEELSERYPFIKHYKSRVKPVMLSTVMSDAGITGIYSFFTGEANINVEYPDYNLPFTAAHELSHQRGISRENEASFLAFLVCLNSDDAYIRYSGYLSLYEYLASALYSTDRELYYELSSDLPEGIKSDMRASAEVTLAHKDSLLGKINDKLNDGYLKLNGTDGVVSYSYVVRLAVAYYSQ